MNPIDFLFNLLASHLQLTPEDYDNVRARAITQYEQSTGKIKDFLSSPYVVLLLPVVLPLLKRAIDALLSRWFGDQDDDGDVDLADALATIVEKLRKQNA